MATSRHDGGSAPEPPHPPPAIDEDNLPDPFDEHDASPQEEREEGPAAPNAIVAWIDSRIGIEEMSNVARKKTVPKHRFDVWYYFGGLTLLFFIVQMLTGLLLLVYYQPGVTTAHASVSRITSQVEFGWLIRSVHSWSANLMLLAAFVHMFSVYFMKAFRKPRELTWGTGVVLLVLGLVFGFSGYLLPWDQLAYAGAKIALKSVSDGPGGATIALLAGAPLDASGQPNVGAVALQRFFALHVAVMPTLFMPILGLHLWLVQKHGNAIPPSEEGKPTTKTVPFFPNFLYKDLVVWLLALNLLTILAAFFPWELGDVYDVAKPMPPGVKPEWYFLSQYELLKLMPAKVGPVEGELFGMGLFTLGAGFWAMVPIWDRGTDKGARLKRINYVGYGAVASIIVLTMLGYSGWPSH
jgi:cytochrome b6